MQIAPIAAPIAPATQPVAPGRGGNDTTWGSLGTVRIGLAINGISYSDHEVKAASGDPIGRYTGTWTEAFAGARNDLFALETAGIIDSRVGAALINTGHDEWTAVRLDVDPLVLRAIDNGPGTGGIASVDFRPTHDGVATLLTSFGEIDIRRHG